MKQPRKPQKKRPSKSRERPKNTQAITKKRPKKVTKTATKRKKSKRKKKWQQRKRRQQLYKEIGLSFLLFIALFVLSQRLFFSFPLGQGYAMTPTLNDGERFFVSKKSTIKRFDLIYFKDPIKKQTMIRRVIALPGEELNYENDQLLINKKPVVERFLNRELKEAAEENRLLTEDFSLIELTATRALPEDCYFVLGDNRHYAADSREFGWIEKKNILGVVKARLLPLHQMTQF
jgi:signal peptidase I